MLNWVENAFFLLNNDKTSEIENFSKYERFGVQLNGFCCFGLNDVS